MTQAYSVRPRDSQAPVLVFDEPSAEAAAAAFFEGWFPSGEEDGAAVIVREIDSGQEHCFRIDADTGRAAPCG